MHDDVIGETIERQIVDLITAVYPSGKSQKRTDKFTNYSLPDMLEKFKGRELQLYYVLCITLEVEPVEYMHVSERCRRRQHP